MRTSLIRLATSATSKNLGRESQNHIPQGISGKSLRHHFALWPLFGALGFAVVLATGFATRMIFKASDISWKKEEAAYNYYKDKQYKFMSPRGIAYEQHPDTKAAQDLLREIKSAPPTN